MQLAAVVGFDGFPVGNLLVPIDGLMEDFTDGVLVVGFIDGLRVPLVGIIEGNDFIGVLDGDIVVN